MPDGIENLPMEASGCVNYQGELYVFNVITAPVLIKSTTTAGKIKVRAAVVWQGKTTPVDGLIEFESVKSEYPLIGCEKEMKTIQQKSTGMLFCSDIN